MKEEQTDVVIIGAGPSGSMAGLEAVKRNVVVIILEEHPVVGDPNHCSGLITKKGIEKLGIKFPQTIIDNSINAVNFWSPSNYKLTIHRKKSQELFVFQRNNLDRVIADVAIKNGVELRVNEKVTHLLKEGRKITGVRVKPKNKEPYFIKSKVVVDASGSASQFMKQADLTPPNPQWRLPAMQYELINIPDYPKNFVELFHGKKWAPGFFAWAIPTCKDGLRIGLASWKGLKIAQLLEKFYKFHPVGGKWFKNSKIVQKRGGVITASGPAKRTWANGYLAVGDTAGQVKATTGGGVNIGGYCGMIAGRIAAAHIHDGISLAQYDKLWKKEFYLELKLMEFIRKTLSSLSDKALDKIFLSAIQSNIGKKLANTKDIDLHGKDLLLKAFDPYLMATGIKLFPTLVQNFVKTLT